MDADNNPDCMPIPPQRLPFDAKLDDNISYLCCGSSSTEDSADKNPGSAVAAQRLSFDSQSVDCDSSYLCCGDATGNNSGLMLIPSRRLPFDAQPAEFSPYFCCSSESDGNNSRNEPDFMPIPPQRLPFDAQLDDNIFRIEPRESYILAAVDADQQVAWGMQPTQENKSQLFEITISDFPRSDFISLATSGIPCLIRYAVDEASTFKSSTMLFLDSKNSVVTLEVSRGQFPYKVHLADVHVFDFDGLNQFCPQDVVLQASEPEEQKLSVFLVRRNFSITSGDQIKAKTVCIIAEDSAMRSEIVKSFKALSARAKALASQTSPRQQLPTKVRSQYPPIMQDPPVSPEDKRKELKVLIPHFVSLATKGIPCKIRYAVDGPSTFKSSSILLLDTALSLVTFMHYDSKLAEGPNCFIDFILPLATVSAIGYDRLKKLRPENIVLKAVEPEEHKLSVFLVRRLQAQGTVCIITENVAMQGEILKSLQVLSTRAKSMAAATGA